MIVILGAKGFFNLDNSLLEKYKYKISIRTQHCCFILIQESDEEANTPKISQNERNNEESNIPTSYQIVENSEEPNMPSNNEENKKE